MGNEFWVETIVFVCHLINIFPSTAIERKTPMQIWTSNSATDYDSLHVFCSTIYYYVNKSKLDQRIKKALFINLTAGVKGYRL